MKVLRLREGNRSSYNLTSPKSSHGARKASQSMNWYSLGVPFTHSPQRQIALSLPFIPTARKTNSVACLLVHERDLNSVSDLKANNHFKQKKPSFCDADFFFLL